jgi:hypothetical protein
LRNDITDNSLEGIFLASDTVANVIRCNNIFDNNGSGVVNSNSGATVDARNNWWGDASGPYATTNPSGTGDSVSNYVSYDPWLPMEFQNCPECGLSVGGEVYPIDGDGLDSGSTLVLWIGVASALAIGGGIFVLRRRGAH